MSWGCHERTELIVFQRPPAGHADASPRLPGTIGGNERPRDAVDRRRATDVRRILHVRSDRWPTWACRRAPTQTGGAPRTQAGSVRDYDINCTAIPGSAYLRRRPPWHGILDASLGFPEPCGHPGLQPSPKHVPGGLLKGDASIFPTPSANAAPTACPACQSSLIVTKTKRPDDGTYWRCTACGEIWNVSRTEADRHRAVRWR